MMLNFNQNFSRWKESFDNKSTTTEDEARLDIKANRLWDSRFNRTFFDVKIFNPLAKSCPKQIKEAYKYHEALKKLKYEQRIIEVENSSLNPLVFATIARIAQKISEKTSEPYDDVVGFIRTWVVFALLRSSILCLRGCRSLKDLGSIPMRRVFFYFIYIDASYGGN